MKISAFCIKHKVATILAFIMIALFGVYFYSSLKLSLMPNMEYPAAVVACTYVGATPEDVEELVTKPLEESIASVSGVKSITSSSAENFAMVMIEYEEGTDVDNAANKLREQFDLLDLPDDCNDPIIFNFNADSMMPVSIIALSGSDPAQLQNLAEDTVGPALERVTGVASVDVAGGVEQEIVVETNPNAMAGYGLSISDVAQYLAAANLLYPGGDVNNGTNILTATTNGKYQTVDDVANTVIFLPQGGTVHLNEIANVYLDTDLSGSEAKLDGESCVILMVNKSSGANEVEICRAVSSALDELKADNASVDATIVYESQEFIMQVANNAIQNIILGVLLSAVVVFAFLRQGGSTVTISLSMPFCVLAVFLLMKFCDLSLNMMTLGGIALCIGMVVDNSIVVLENIYRYAGDGYSKYDSCVLGTSEVVTSITASSLTTIAVFLPIGLSGGMSGMMFKDFCLTVVFLILSSLLIALTLVPLMCYFLLDENAVRLQKLTGGGAKAKESRLKQKIASLSDKYQRLLKYFITHRLKAMLISVGLVVAFLLCCLSTNMVLIPDIDQGQVSITIDMPNGTELEDTAAYADRVTSIIQEHCEELDNMYMTIGGSVLNSGTESASITVNLVDKDQRSRSSKEVADYLEEYMQDIAGCEITVDTSSMMSMLSSSDVEVDISGDDYDVLEDISVDLVEKISALSDAEDVESSLEDSVPAIKIEVNHDAASEYHLTAATIGSTVRAQLTGVTATTVTIDGDDLDVVVQGDGSSAENLDALRSMAIATPTGGTVPLSSVANVYVELTPQTISREDQVRQVQVTGNSVSGDSTGLSQAVQEILDAYELPEGYQAEISGTYSEMMENFTALGQAMIVAIGLVYFILAAQFESFIMPIMIMLILPVALAGGLFGLPVTGQDLSMIAMLALIMLVGTVVNSSIVLVDYITIRRTNGMKKDEAILAACPLRVRPILMTTLTTVLALIPMALGTGEGNEMLQPMGIVMIFGMMISTVVTLLFTPVYYSVLDSLSEKIAQPFQRRKDRKQAKLAEALAAAEARVGGPDSPHYPTTAGDSDSSSPRNDS